MSWAPGCRVAVQSARVTVLLLYGPAMRIVRTFPSGLLLQRVFISPKPAYGYLQILPSVWQ